MTKTLKLNKKQKEETNKYLTEAFIGHDATLFNYIEDYRPLLDWLCLAKDIVNVSLTKASSAKCECSIIYFKYGENEESIFFGESYHDYHTAVASTIGEAVCLVAIWYLKEIDSKRC